MRTTLELPDRVLREAKIAAVKRGVTLRELVNVALRRELGLSLKQPAKRRVKFPIFSSKAPGSRHVTAADIRKAEAEEDARRHGFARRR